MRLGELLIGDGQIDARQREEGLKRQVLHGGRLGTNLVELQFISVEDLALALGRQHHLPAALESHFADLDPQLLEKLSPEMAATWHAIPIGRTGVEGCAVAIATPDPLDQDITSRLQACFDSEIILAICPELRMLYWLEELYQIERTNRFKRVPRLNAAQPVDKDDERRGYMQTLSDTESPQSASPLARVAVKQVSVPVSSEIEIPIALLEFKECIRAIRQSSGRGRMISLVTHLLQNGLGGQVTAGMLLTIRGPIAVGWKGFVRNHREIEIDALAVPLDESSVFGPPRHTGNPFCGAPSTLSTPPTTVDHRFWGYLGEPPKAIAIFPVYVLDQMVSLLYVQSDSAFSPETGQALKEVAEAISLSLVRLIRAANR